MRPDESRAALQFRPDRVKVVRLCSRCKTVVAEVVQPCQEFPAGAVIIRQRHHGEAHQTVIELPERKQS